VPRACTSSGQSPPRSVYFLPWCLGPLLTSLYENRSPPRDAVPRYCSSPMTPPSFSLLPPLHIFFFLLMVCTRDTSLQAPRATLGDMIRISPFKGACAFPPPEFFRLSSLVAFPPTFSPPPLVRHTTFQMLPAEGPVTLEGVPFFGIFFR